MMGDRSRFMTIAIMAGLLATALFLCGCGGDKPDTDDTGPAPAEARVTIFRDAWGIPYVFADTEQGAQYGHGYVQAKDHLDQMLINFLFADARLAETFDDGAPELEAAGYGELSPLEMDRMALQYRFRNVADQGWEDFDALDLAGWEVPTSELIEAFADGVNYFMETHPEAVPTWWKGVVDPRTVVAWSRVLPLSFQIEWINSKLPEGAGDSPEGSPNGSNGWVMGPSRTASGNVMVQSDPHQPWTGPTIWYEVHLSGGQAEVGGGTPYGIPFPAFAHNRYQATTLTSNGMNNADVFAVTVDPADPTRYLYGDESRPFEFDERSVTRPDGSTATLKLAWTHQGPVLLPRDTTDFSGAEQVYVGAATMYEQANPLTELRAIGAATDLDSWFEGLRLLQLAKWNIMIGTVNGHIAYVNNSRHPERLESVNYKSGPVDGSDPNVDWTTRPPWDFEDLATFTDPAAGFLQNCNNSPGWSTPNHNEEIDESAWPSHYMKQNNNGLRSQTALLELDASNAWTYEALRDLSVSDRVLMAERWVPALQTAAETWGTNPEVADTDALAASMALLEPWAASPRATVDSGAMTLFDRWRARVSGAVDLKDAPPESVSSEQGIWALNQLVDGWLDLEALHGSGDVPWGDMHRIRRGDLDLPLSGGTSALGTLKVGNTGGGDDVGYAESGSSYMRLVELRPGQAPRITSVKPWGNSDDPKSPHHGDLTELFANGEYKELWFDRTDVEANAVITAELEY